MVVEKYGCTMVKWGLEDEPKDGELEAYVTHGKEKYPKENITLIEIEPSEDKDMVDIKYTFSAQHKFHRLRRITGYLVGDLSRWNNGKSAEEKDRVAHLKAE